MKTIYLRLCLLLGAVCTLLNVSAQQTYGFHVSAAPYTPLTDPVRVYRTQFDSVNDLYNITGMNGQIFYFYRTPFPLGGLKTFTIQSNGNLRIDNDSTMIIIDGVFTWLDSIDASSAISYQIDGTPGHYIFKAQWTNFKLRNGADGNNASFQIWVHQLTGHAEIRFGPSTESNRSGYNTSTGPHIGMFFSEDDFTKCYEKLWITGTPTAPRQDSAANYVFKAMTGIPPEGTVYSFIPRSNTTGLLRHTFKQGLRVYPNPVKDGYIYTEDPDSYIITDLHGKDVLHTKCTTAIDVSALPKGVYMIRTKTSGGTRFVIE